MLGAETASNKFFLLQKAASFYHFFSSGSGRHGRFLSLAIHDAIFGCNFFAMY